MAAQDIVTKATEAFNRHDADAFATLYTTEAVAHDPQYTQPLKGREAIRKDIEDWFRAFPDVQASVASVVSGGETVAVEMRMTGTNKGPIASPAGEIPATNKRIDISLAWFVRVNGQGLITEDRRYFDMAGLAQQLGIE
ncbi:MAG TPA: ester cyclase [Dehalococcoidia bacterium]|nr:ester cyclase [Dehalococcoidia bacterium]